MKAVAVFPSSRESRVITNHPEPRIELPTQVKIKMLEVGVCGTDREIAAFDYGTPPAGFEYLAIGHESLGQVVETGSAVTNLKVGDLVVTMVRRPCLHEVCVACRSGRQDFCSTGDFKERGIKELHGFMTEYVVDEQQYIVVVPSSLRDIAVLTEPLTIAEKALAQIWQVQQRLPWGCPPPENRPDKNKPDNNKPAENHSAVYCHTAVVLGAGPVGILGAMMLVANGFETYVYSRTANDEARVSLVKSFGAQFIKAETNSVEQMAQRVGGIDVVYEAVGASQLAFDVMKVLDANAVFVFTGIPGRRGAISIDADTLMRNLVLKNQVVFGTVNAGREHYEAAIRDLEKFAEMFPDAVRNVITGRYAIDEALPLLKEGFKGIKSVVSLV